MLQDTGHAHSARSLCDTRGAHLHGGPILSFGMRVARCVGPRVVRTHGGAGSRRCSPSRASPPHAHGYSALRTESRGSGRLAPTMATFTLPAASTLRRPTMLARCGTWW